jgi:TolB-like protein
MTVRGSASVIQSSKGVFLSYASEDAGVAQRLCDALRIEGIEVWFDQSELRGGDAWDQKIRQQIRDCALFVPIISANTQARSEGYFRLEWRLAVDRSHLMVVERVFLVPLVVDETTEPEALVPAQFREVQWTRIQAGKVPPEFVDRIAALLNQPVAHRVGSPERGINRAPTRRLPVAVIGLSVAAAAVLVIAIAMRGGWLWHKPVIKVEPRIAPASSVATPAVIPEKSVAVLPFLDMSEQRDQEYFTDGLSEELIDMLTKVPDLRVPARTSSFFFKGKQTTIADIARALGVAHVLEGSVRKSGDRLRITAQLIQANSGYHLWSQTYDRKTGDIFKIQDDLAAAVVKSLKASLLPTAANSAPSSPDAYALFLQAKYYGARNWDIDYERKQHDALVRALKIDPSFAPAWAALSENLTLEAVGKAPELRDQHRRQATMAAERARSLDPTIPEPHLALSKISFWFDWDWTASQAELDRALALDPTNTMALAWAAYMAETLGHREVALRLQQQATTRDPLNPKEQFFLGEAYLIVERYKEAEAAFRKSRDLNPSQELYFWNLTLVSIFKGDASAALTHIRGEPELGFKAAGLAIAYHALGRHVESNAAMADAEAQLGVDDPFDVACTHAYRNEPEQAFAWLERAYERRQPQLVYLLRQPLLRAVRQDPRWSEFLRKMKLPE